VPHSGAEVSRVGEPWDLEPVPEDTSLGETLKAAGTGALISALTLTGLGFIIVPNLVEARGATRTWVLEKERRARCLDLGLTPEQLEAAEAAEAPPRSRSGF